MAVVENRFVCDLSKPVQAQALKGNVFSLDNLGSRISVLIYENGQPATISGSVTANCILPDGSTVNVNGGLTTEGDGSKAYVDVPQSCLLIPGILKIAIKCTSSSVITTLAAIVANVYMTKTDNVITPSQQIINDWNAEISASLANQDAEISDIKSAFGAYASNDNQITIKERISDKSFSDPFSNTGYYTSDGEFVANASVTNTGLVYIKGYTKLVARGYLNSGKAAIAFFDAAKNYLPDISVVNSSSGASYTAELVADLTSATYKEAFYCCVCSYSGGTYSMLSMTQIGSIYDLIDYANEFGYDAVPQSEYYSLNGDFPINQKVGTDGVTVTDVYTNATPYIPVKKNAKLYASTYYKNTGYWLAFFDKYKRLLPSISLIPSSSALEFTSETVDLSANGYEDVCYVRVFDYAVASNGTGVLRIAYTDKGYGKYVPDLMIGPFRPNLTGGEKINGYHADAAILSTGLIPFDNKRISRVVAHTYINGAYYHIAFYDQYKKVITAISVTNNSSGAVVTDDTIDVTGSAYDNAKYISICTWTGATTYDARLYLYDNEYLTTLQDGLDIQPQNVLSKKTACIFKKVVCCGDSYTAGWIKRPDSSAFDETNEEYAWPHYISVITGNKWENCGHSGADVLTWQTLSRGLPKARTLGKTQAYVIGLMINDIGLGHVPLGTVDDIGTDNETYYGGMSKIIRELAGISPDAFIFVNTCPKPGESFDNYNEAVRVIVSTYANTYKVHCIDLAAHADMYSNPSFTGDALQGHYTAIGYQQMAEIYCYLLSDYINNHISTFQGVHKIPYDE